MRIRVAVLAVLCLLGVVPATTASAADLLDPTPFASWAAMVDRLYIDVTATGPSASQRSAAVAALSAGTKTPGAVVADLRAGTDNTTSVDPMVRLYRAFLLRTPDKGGLDFWIKRRRAGTWTLVRIADSFANSSEFIRRYGSLSNEAFVRLIYDGVLERPHDASGLAFWTRQLDNKKKSRGAVMANFSESSEYQRKQAAEVEVSVLHVFLLGRAPTKTEFDAGVASIEAGQSRALYASSILGSMEWKARVASAVSITTESLGDATQGSPYSADLSATGGVKPYTWSATGLPAGMAIDSATGRITGAATTVGTTAVSVKVTSASGPSASRQLSLRVVAVQGQTFSTPALPSGNERFIDSLGRDLLGRAPSAAERSAWSTQLSSGTTRTQLAATLASSDAFLAVVVDNVYASLLDRLPTDAERTTGVAGVRTSGTTSGLATSLLASAEFFALAESTNNGWVNTAAQRVLHRDLWPEELSPFVTALTAGSKTRLQVAVDLYGWTEAAHVRAKMWTQKLLSRDPSDAELTTWGAQVKTSGELSAIAAIAGTSSYLALTQERIVEASFTTTPGTVVVSGSQIVSAVFTDAGNGTVVLASGVTPPAVGHHLVVNVPADPAAGGIGKVTALTPGTNGQVTVTLAAAGLADAFATGTITDTTEATDPVAATASGDALSNADDPACLPVFSTMVRANIGIDTRNDSKISWSLTDYDAQVLAHITPKLTVALNELSLSRSCKTHLWQTRWNAPITVGPLVLPGYFQIGSDLGVSAQVSALDLSASLALPCKVGVRATKAGVSNLSGCSSLRSSLTVTPRAEASLKAFADLELGYYLGADKGGWAKANIGLSVGLELGIELKASLQTNPYWTADAYADLNLDLTGNLLGRWEVEFNLANRRVLQRRIASGAHGQGTPAGGGVSNPNPSGAVKPGPVLHPPRLTGVAKLTGGSFSTCALLTDGTAKCWGDNRSGQLGDGTTASSSVPVTVAGLTGATALTSGYANYCALLADGTAKCWGNNSNGELGNGTTASSSVPVTVTGLTGATAITHGSSSTCALLTDGTAKCWGYNGSGQLGNGTTTSSTTPVTVAGLTGATAITSGTSNNGSSYCALLTDGTAKCWGYNGSGQLGNGTISDFKVPVAVTGLTGATAITSGYDSYCALLSDGTAKCWGSNFYGQIGTTTIMDSTVRVPVTVTGLTGATAITRSYASYCALLAGGTAKCWGFSGGGALGNGTTTNSSVPVTVTGLTGATAIAGHGGNGYCALLAGGTAKCWGNNPYGELGNGTTTNSSVPVTVTGLTGATAITGQTPCALLTGGTATCWGRNSYGELGNGTTTDSSVPVTVVIE